jgi:hypothetical protein
MYQKRRGEDNFCYTGESGLAVLILDFVALPYTFDP